MANQRRAPQRQDRVSTVEESQIRVIPYHSDWPVLYQNEAQRLRAILSGIAVDVQHFGSTAVPGLDAKPNVDILVGVPAGASLATEQIDALTQHGYEYLGEDGRRPGRVFFRKRGGASFNLSVVPFGSELWQDNLAIRDYLRTHPGQVRQYAGVKYPAAAQSPHSLLGYQNRKRDFVEKLRELARAWAASGGRRTDP